KEQVNVKYFTEVGLRTKELYKENLPFYAEFLSFNNDSISKQGSLDYQLQISKDKTGFSLENEITGEALEASWYDTLELAAGKITFVPNPYFKGGEKENYILN